MVQIYHAPQSVLEVTLKWVTMNLRFKEHDYVANEGKLAFKKKEVNWPDFGLVSCTEIKLKKNSCKDKLHGWNFLRLLVVVFEPHFFEQKLLLKSQFLF